MAYIQSQYQSSFNFVKRALKLLHEWRMCIYFDNSIKLKYCCFWIHNIILKTILGDLFKAHKWLNYWLFSIKNYLEFNWFLYHYWEKFEVCLFWKINKMKIKRNIIPNLLPDPHMISYKLFGIDERIRKIRNFNFKPIEKEKVINERVGSKENRRMISIEYELNWK